ncbi:ATP-binding domain-containing protein [Alcaligenaceae bacterium B3P038]|nr:ATP-binding domain-containing protein [Alcaligenaceae bacterium B3P038]
MTLQVLPRESATRADTSARMILEHLIANQRDLALDTCTIFYNFPLFREDDHLLVAELVIASPVHGVTLISTAPGGRSKAEDRLEGAFSQIFARLVKYPRLRTGRAQLSFELEAFVWVPEGHRADGTKVGLPELSEFFAANSESAPMPDTVFQEILSVLDGSKALIKPRERDIADFPEQSRINTIAQLEEEIRKFDRDQRVAYMTEVMGLQRIQGLAGSGKTVVLAIKAALTAIREPDARIAVTFYTKSLYQHIRQLITRFYRLHEDRDPDWDKVQILHAWGGATVEGLYHKSAQRFGHRPINFADASRAAPSHPFAYVCDRLLKDTAVESIYDYVFVDEAQDFPPEFMKLALRLAKEEKLVIAYDVFQTIFDVDVPTAATMFGEKDSQEFQELVFDEDVILHKCYRNPREILMCSHAIGFGIYGKKIAQMLESAEHWEDFGYKFIGNFVPGEIAKINRPEENSPSSVSKLHSIDEIISCEIFNSFDEEVAFVADKIHRDIVREGVPPEDILVVSTDDRNAGSYFIALKRALAAQDIKTNNLQNESFELQDFQRKGCVTLSTVYKAKGNEAYSVYLLGIDALFASPTPRNRNRAFTAMTRAKAWLCVTGIGEAAKDFRRELQTAKRHFPNLVFKYPTSEELVYMKRDLIIGNPEDVDEEISRLGTSLEADEFERLLKRKLREIQTHKKIIKRVR